MRGFAAGLFIRRLLMRGAQQLKRTADLARNHIEPNPPLPCYTLTVIFDLFSAN